jgi:carboxylesterase
VSETYQAYEPFWLGPTDADTACLLIHGFSGNPAEMRTLGDYLAQQGMRVYAMLVTGHSGNPDELLRAGRRQWLASAEDALAKLTHYRHIFVIGLSMGGVLALRLGIQHPQQITGVVALSTPTRFRGSWQVRLVPLARYFVGWFYPLAKLDFNNSKVQAEVLKQARQRDPTISIDFNDPQTVAHLKQMVRIPVPAIAELFALTNQTRRLLPQLYKPLLIIHSKHDQTVDPSCASELARLAIHASPRTLHWLEHSGHVITTDIEHELVYQWIKDFIATTINASGPAQS